MANIDVLIVDSISSTKHNASLPDDVPVGRLTQALVRKMKKPQESIRLIDYFLRLARTDTNTKLDKGRTLRQHGITAGDTLLLDERTVLGVVRCFKIAARCPVPLQEDEDFIFVAMPFGGEFDNVYQGAIRPALTALKCRFSRADDVKWTADLMCKICQLIQKAKISIVDISQWNPNVLLELGMIYGMGKEAILLKKRGDGAPVDLRGMEYLEYDNHQKLADDLRAYLTRVL